MPIVGVGMVRVCIDAKDDTSNLLLMGMARVECLGAEKYRPYRLERVRVMESSGEDSPEIESLVQQDLADLQILHVRKTPSYFVNGTPLETFGYDPLVALVESELAAQYPE